MEKRSENVEEEEEDSNEGRPRILFVSWIWIGSNAPIIIIHPWQLRNYAQQTIPPLVFEVAAAATTQKALLNYILPTSVPRL